MLKVEKIREQVVKLNAIFAEKSTKIMTNIILHNVIDNEQVNQFWNIDGKDVVFSLDTFQNILAEHEKETDFCINIHCDGGSVSEGLAIYDAIRTSGKTFHCNIEGNCHSMAVVILLAAPKENRTANPNCRALIHKVSAPMFDYATADQFRAVADEIEREQNAILDIYADRTGYDRQQLADIMAKEKMHTADELLELGFISKINIYSTNLSTKKRNQMKKENLLERITNFVNSLKAVNFDHLDANGNVIFSTTKEDETIAVGDEATPDGKFILADGREVIVADGKITEINEPAPAEPIEPENEEPTEEPNAEVEALKAEIEEVKAENEELKKQLEEAKALLAKTKNQIVSNYKPAARTANAKVEKPSMSFDEMRNELESKRNKFLGK